MHAGLLILLWLIGVAILQSLDGVALFVAVFCCAAAALYCAGAKCLRLLKRIRYLLAAIIVLFAFFTPGQALFIDFPRLSPSLEGIGLAAEQVGRILTVVCCVAVLMQHLSTNRLIGGIYALLRPFAALGVPTERIAVRIMLTLRNVDADIPHDWRRWLMAADADLPGGVKIAKERFSGADRLVVAALAVLSIAWIATGNGL